MKLSHDHDLVIKSSNSEFRFRIK